MAFYSENFHSIEELLEATKQRPMNKVFREARKESSKDGSKSFTGTKSYEEAVDLLKYGFTEPIAKIKKGVFANAQGISVQKTAIKNDVVGFAPCVPAAILGVPQSMINKEINAKKAKILTIIYDSTGSCAKEQKEFIDAGIAVLTIVNSLEASGYRVSLKNAFWCGKESDEYAFATVDLKDWRQPLDIRKITFPFCHPSMLRRIGFKYIETHPRIKEDWTCGYGTALSTRDSYSSIKSLLEKNGVLEKNVFYLNMRVCEENEYDPQKIAKACGLEIDSNNKRR